MQFSVYKDIEKSKNVQSARKTTVFFTSRYARLSRKFHFLKIFFSLTRQKGNTIKHHECILSVLDKFWFFEFCDVNIRYAFAFAGSMNRALC